MQQASLICSQDYNTWDPKITTLPGLYYISYFIYIVLSQWNPSLHCSLTFLRNLNCVFGFLMLTVLANLRQSVSTRLIHIVTLSIGSSWLKYWLNTQIYPTSNDARLLALLLVLIPPNFFYFFLYYTDTMSSTFVLITYALVLRRRKLRRANNNHNSAVFHVAILVVRFENPKRLFYLQSQFALHN